MRKSVRLGTSAMVCQTGSMYAPRNVAMRRWRRLKIGKRYTHKTIGECTYLGRHRLDDDIGVFEFQGEEITLHRGGFEA